jgi:hypothetical protein
MIRLALRQLRMPALSTAAMLAALAAFLILTERSMTSYLSSSGLAACLAAHGNCGAGVSAFITKYNVLIGLFVLLNVVPMLAGLFWGAPLVAREVEQGTHRLAWTQSVTRRHWLAVKIGLYVAGTIVAGALLTALFTWWSHPFARVSGSGGFSFSRINPDVYDFSGTVLTAYTLYAFALGTAAGVIIRRTVPAMAVTVAGFLALRVPMEAIRGHLLHPFTIIYPLRDGVVSPRAGLGDWIISSTTIDAAGRPVGMSCQGGGLAGGVRCHLTGNNLRMQDVYQPVSRFWPLQGIETGIVLALVLALLAMACWWTIRRIA